MRIVRAALLALGLLLGTLPGSGLAQDRDPGFTLLGVSPFVGQDRLLSVTFALTNPGSIPLEDLTIRISVHNRVFSRSELRAALDGNPGGDVLVVTTDQVEPLVSGERRVRTLTRDLGTLAGTFRAQGRDGVYPVSVRLISGGRDLAHATTAVPFFFTPPSSRLNVAWIYPVHLPAAFDARGVYPSGTIERHLAPGAGLRAVIEALASRPSAPVTIAPTGLTLDQLDDAGDGYPAGGRRAVHPGDPTAVGARRALAALRRAVGSPAIDLASSTYSRADIIGLLSNRMQSELSLQLSSEDERIRRLLGRPATPGLFVPPDFRLDKRSAGAIAATGARVVAIAPESLPQSLTNFGFDRPQALAGGNQVRLTGLVVDPAIRDRLSSRRDPVLAAQGVVAETAASFFELPALASERLLVVGTPTSPDSAAAGALLDALAGAPWVRLLTATQAASALPPTDKVLALDSSTDPDRPALSAARAARRAVDTLVRVLEPERPVELLERLILAAQSADWIADPSRGSILARAARGRAERTLDLIRVPERRVTLTSRIAQIPVTLVNGTGQPVRVRVTLDSTKMRFPRGASRNVTVAQRVFTMTFQAETRVSGSFPVVVRLETLDGAPVGQSELVVRSTRVSAVTLIITLGGAIALFLTWMRRALRSRSRNRAPV